LFLLTKIEQQRTTIAELKKADHETTDAERHLGDLEAELKRVEASSGKEEDGHAA
jgi:hypothetical protein